MLCGVEAHVCVHATAVDFINRGFQVQNKMTKKPPSQIDVAPWCYKWVSGWLDGSLRGGRYRAPYLPY